MCGLFGFSLYGNTKIKNLSELTNSLAIQSAERGTDATGIAFCYRSNIKILKESKSAYQLNFRHSDDIAAIIGHTRHSTQGSEKKNDNNHPFHGNTKNTSFALTHNGVLINDTELRKKYHLPKTKIETDSYIAVQLIESQKAFDFGSIQFMAKEIVGSFSFAILDDQGNIYLVKGDSPLSILHCPKLKIYVYASTDEILYKALVDYSPLFSALKYGEFEPIGISDGEILKICADGRLERNSFPYSYYHGKDWWDYGSFSTADLKKGANVYTKNDDIDNLKSVASMLGYSPDDIDDLLHNGFSPEEIEEYLYFGSECEI